MSARPDNQPSQSSPQGKFSKQEQQTWMLVVMSVLCLALLLLVYELISPDSFPGSLKQMALDLIPGFVGALFAFVLFHFIFTTKGIDLGSSQSIDNVVSELKDIVYGTRALDPLESIEIDQLYTLYGLKGTVSSEIFQDFRIDRDGRNKNAVQFLWADALHGNTIDGEIKKNKDGDAWLRIGFNIKNQFRFAQNWGCNFAIKPQKDLAIDNNSVKRHYLIFDARVPEDTFNKLRQEGKEPLNEVGFAIRVVNGYLQHWEYGSNKVREFKQLRVSVDEGWKSFAFQLSDKNIWALFDSDGLVNGGPKYPIFDEIASLIIKVGRPEKMSGELEPGLGVIDIRDVRLSEFPLET